MVQHSAGRALPSVRTDGQQEGELPKRQEMEPLGRYTMGEGRARSFEEPGVVGGDEYCMHDDLIFL